MYPTQLSMKFNMLINVKMPTIYEHDKYNILASESKKSLHFKHFLDFISIWNSMFNWVEHDKKVV